MGNLNEIPIFDWPIINLLIYLSHLTKRKILLSVKKCSILHNWNVFKTIVVIWDYSCKTESVSILKARYIWDSVKQIT